MLALVVYMETERRRCLQSLVRQAHVAFIRLGLGCLFHVFDKMCLLLSLYKIQMVDFSYFYLSTGKTTIINIHIRN